MNITQLNQVPGMLPVPKVNGVGTVYKKDGSVSTPPKPEEKKNGRNS